MDAGSLPSKESILPSYSDIGVGSIEAMLRRNMTMSGIAKAFNIGRTTLYTFLEKSGVDDIDGFRRSCKFNQVFFEVVDSEEKAYWLGFLFAELFERQNNPPKADEQFAEEIMRSINCSITTDIYR